ncbi:MAG: hypothetical protein ACOYI8_01915 [Christensenellales bacterium]|jgi:hypothetical protein
MAISAKDLERLRTLAKKQRELSETPQMASLRRDWEAHGRFEPNTRPLVRIELWTFADDLLPQMLECEGEEARALEWMFLSNTINFDTFHDDTLVEGCLPVMPRTHFLPFGLEVKRELASDQALGHHFIPYLSDLEEDFHKLGKSVFSVDIGAAQTRVDYLNELFGDILPAKRVGFSLYACPMQDIVHIMSMEDMFVAMYDYPELFHKMLSMLADDYIEFFRLIESSGALMSTKGSEHLAQGTYCFTDELPDVPASTRDVWGYLDSQETSGISPEMYKEFVLPAYKRISANYGLLSYGCCEAVHALWTNGLDALQNLRKISISPWCDEEFMGEALRGKNVVYLRKPTPNLLGVGDTLDEDAVLEHIGKTARAAKGCHLEIAQRDVYRVSASCEKVRRYVELIRKALG